MAQEVLSSVRFKMLQLSPAFSGVWKTDVLQLQCVLSEFLPYFSAAEEKRHLFVVFSSFSWR